MHAESSPSFQLSCLLLTGAAGGLGRVLRPRLKRICDRLRLSDIVEMGPEGPGEELHTVRLEDRASVMRLMEGVEAVVHLGGISTEAPFDEILKANILGTYNVYEAARACGVKRIVFASSNHVSGFRRRDESVRPMDPVRPDSHYGVSKAFGENLAQFYWDRYGLETVSLRIGSSFPEPKDRRMLSTWLSYDDLERLVLAALRATSVGHTVVYGVSNNPESWWDNTTAQHLGYAPKDSSSPYRTGIESQQQSDEQTDPAAIYQGGSFVKLGPFNS